MLKFDLKCAFWIAEQMVLLLLSCFISSSQKRLDERRVGVVGGLGHKSSVQEQANVDWRVSNGDTIFLYFFFFLLTPNKLESLLFPPLFFFLGFALMYKRRVM